MSSTGSPVRPPLAVRWDMRLGTVTSNIVVADGRVIFVRTDATSAPQLTALDAASGAHLWSVATPAARIAYDGGRVFATQGTGVAAFSAQTGARLWTRDLEADYGVPHLVADAGTVYALVDEPGSRVAAVRASRRRRRCGRHRRSRPGRARRRSTPTACTSGSAAARPTR